MKALVILQLAVLAISTAASGQSTTTLINDSYILPQVNDFDLNSPPPQYRGDFNNDGVKNDADYTVWCDYFEPKTPPPQYQRGSGPHGGYTDADYTTWANQPPTPTPEPASLSLLLLGAGAIVRRRKA